MADGGADATFGNVAVGSFLDRTYTIENTGSATLTINLGSFNVTGDYTLQTPPAASVVVGGTTTFVIRFTPSTTGVRAGNVSFENNDSNENPYNFSLTGTGTGPNIRVSGNGNTIAHNDVTPVITDHTDFGDVDVNTDTRERIFTIHNDGNADLNLGVFTITGAHFADFTKTANPTSPVPPGGTTTLGVLFDPSTTGARTAIITIPSNDTDTPSYVFHIQGNGVLTPEMDVQGNGVSIPNGETLTDESNHTFFGSVSTSSGSLTRTFTILNTGSANLTLHATPASRVTVSGAHAANFTVTTQPSPSSIAPAGSLTFVVTFDPSADGERTATLTITNNDSDENPYTFNISGFGAANAPEVDVLDCPLTFDSGTISSANTVVNTYFQSVAGTLNVGADTITLGASGGATTPIERGDLLLIIQMQGGTYNNSTGNNYGDGAGGNTLRGFLTSTAGNYEYVVALSDAPITGGTLSITPTVNSYVNGEPSTSGDTDTGRSRYQIIRVPRYQDLTITAGNSITASAWDGEKGGIVVLDVNGTLNMSGTGTINANELGFRGGVGRQLSGCGSENCGTGISHRTISRSLSTVNANGGKGEGIVGTPRYVYTRTETVIDTGVEGYPSGSHSYGAPGNAGGGGNDDDPANNDENTGGGGGSNGSGGGNGGYAWSNASADIGGRGAAAVPFVATNRLVMGGGGGAGGRNDAGPSSGGTGGGIVFLKVNTITNPGSITANGKNVGATENDGGGGGGAGGSIYITATNTGSLAGLNTSAVGGNGGTAWALTAPSGTPGNRHGPGGGGGGGVILANGALASMNVNPGSAGITTTANDKYGSTGLGDAGITVGIANNSTPEVEYPTQAWSCTDLAVEIETNKFTAAVGQQLTFTIYVTNNTATNATGVSIIDQLPNGYTYVSNSTASGSYDSGTGVWTIGTVSANATVSLTITATVNASGMGVNYMNTASLQRVDQLDIDTTNNSDQTGLSSLWLKADAGTSTVTNNAALNTWNDQSLFGNHATQLVTPDYRLNSLNFNPSVFFNGSSDRMSGNGGYNSETAFVAFHTSSDWSSASTPRTILSANGFLTVGDASGLGIGNISTLAATNELFANSKGIPSSPNQVVSFYPDAVSRLRKEIFASRKNKTLTFGSEIMRNGSNLPVSVVGSLANAEEWTNSPYVIGSSLRVVGGLPGRFFSGEIQEIISFQGRLSDIDTRKMNTYLALKYGKTMAVNYVNMENSVIYDVSSYGNRIFGIGLDSGSSLHQRQARSEDEITESTNAIVTIGNNSILASTNNTANGNDLSTDKTYLISGDDDGLINAWTTVNAPFEHERIERVWKAVKTGNLNQSTRVRATSSRLPAVPAGKVMSLIVVSDPADFPNADFNNPGADIIQMSNDGSNWHCNYVFPAGTSYYTFAITDGCYTDLICTGTAKTWTGAAWTPAGAPNQFSEVTLAGNYNATNLATSITCCKLIVNNGVTLTIGSGGSVNAQSDITVLGTGSIIVQNDGNLMQFHDLAQNSGNITVQRESEPMYPFDYTYWSSPVQNFNLSGIPQNRAYYWNASGGVWAAASGVMSSGIGYIVMTNNSDKLNAVRTTVEFSGPMNNGIVNRPVVTAASRWNLLGNPYPSALDAGEFLTDDVNDDLINGAVYFWTHNTKISGFNNNRGQFTQNDYAIWNLTGGVGTEAPSFATEGGNGNVPNGYIASGQGFFVEGIGTGNVRFKNCMRVSSVNTNNMFFKSNDDNSDKEDPRLWLELTNEEGHYKSILIGYLNGATNEMDRLYDAISRTGENKVSFYSILDDKGLDKKLAIQGRALPLTSTDKIPLGYNIKSEGKHFIKIGNKEGAFKKAQIYLEDKLLNVVHDLNISEYVFESSVVESNDRFVLRFNTTEEESNVLIVDDVKVSSTQEKINIKSETSEIASVQVYNVLGANLYTKHNVQDKSLNIYSVTPKNQVLIVVTTLANGEKSTSKIIY